ncbi:MAG: nucleotide sugar dehydrogenase, partial [Nanoarchaeota archaeon]|nr:nucleotide sugar dehydrogenase [Nanoarchaeota archaeon]
MKILCVGSGYVGLVSGTCFADLGNNVTCLDIDQKKVDSLSKGIIPIYEPGLKELVERNVRLGRLKFTTNTEQAVKQAEVIFICVGTPPKTNGEADMSYVYKAAENIGKHIDSYKVIANKSTVPVGTAEKVKRIINAELKKRKKKIEFDVVSNPEFLREGAAVKDFQNPDRIVVGTTSERAKEMLTKLYRSISRTTKPIFFTNEKNAELIKYASNAMLATRISFMNELSHLCEEIGADIKEVGKGMGLDTRIGSRFLQAGCGYGGSCLDGDEIIIIKETDTIRPIKIKELLNLKLRNLEIGSADLNNNQICFEKIKTATKREYKGDMIKIVTRMNKTLNVTEDHPFLVYEDNSFKIKLARDLSLKDTIPSMLHLPSLSKYDTFIDLIKILDKKTFDFTKVRVRPKNLLFKKFELQLSQKFKSTRLRDIIRSNCMNLKEYLDKDVEGLVPREELLLFTVKGTPSYVPVIIKINSSFMRFLGYYISEGYIHYEKGLRGLRARIGICFNIN